MCFFSVSVCFRPWLAMCNAAFDCGRVYTMELKLNGQFLANPMIIIFLESKSKTKMKLKCSMYEMNERRKLNRFMWNQSSVTCKSITKTKIRPNNKKNIGVWTLESFNDFHNFHKNHFFSSRFNLSIFIYIYSIYVYKMIVRSHRQI